MKVLNLCCSSEHRFEGWFASEDDYRSQLERKLIECPLCADTAVSRLPSAPHVLTSCSRSVPLPEREPQRPNAKGGAAQASASDTVHPNSAAASPSTGEQFTLQSAWLRAVHHVITNTVDVGPRFAEEARRMHYGETDERPIRGQTTSDEARALHDEGIEVMSLPMPAALKGPVQ